MEDETQVSAVDRVLMSTRAVRFRYDFDRPVAMDVVRACLHDAFQAPNGANQQRWGWIAVSDPEIKRAMGDIYRAGMAYGNGALDPIPDGARLDVAGYEAVIRGLVSNPEAEANEEMKRNEVGSGYRMYSQPDEWVGPSRGADFLATRIQDLPYLVVPVYWRAERSQHQVPDGRWQTFNEATHWGSILPAVWSFLLALRARGLGSTWTTRHLHFEREMAELLHIPAGFVQAGLFPLGHVTGGELKPADRSHSELHAIHWDSWTPSC